MKKNLLYAFFLFIILLVQIADGAPDGWLDDLDEALKTAKAEKKHVLADFTATWCGYCKKLNEEVFENEEFKEFVKTRLILASIDADKNRFLIDKYKVNGFPTIVIFDFEGKEVSRIVGFKPCAKFMTEIRRVFPEDKKK